MADEKILPRDLVENPEPPTQSLAILDDGTNVFATSIDDIGNRIGAVRSVQAGLGISVDNTDPLNPIVTATEGGGDMFEAIYDPQGISNDAFARENHTGQIPGSVLEDGSLTFSKLASDVTDKLEYLEFRDVSTLLSNTTLEYGTGAGQVQEGNIIRTREEGFSFAVGASNLTEFSASNPAGFHVEMGVGVKLFVIPDAGGYCWDAFGARGDWTSGLSGTDNASALKRAMEVAFAHCSRSYGLAGAYLTSPFVVETPTSSAIPYADPEQHSLGGVPNTVDMRRRGCATKIIFNVSRNDTTGKVGITFESKKQFITDIMFACYDMLPGRTSTGDFIGIRGDGIGLSMERCSFYRMPVGHEAIDLGYAHIEDVLYWECDVGIRHTLGVWPAGTTCRFNRVMGFVCDVVIDATDLAHSQFERMILEYNRIGVLGFGVRCTFNYNYGELNVEYSAFSDKSGPTLFSNCTSYGAGDSWVGTGTTVGFGNNELGSTQTDWNRIATRQVEFYDYQGNPLRKIAARGGAQLIQEYGLDNVEFGAIAKIKSSRTNAQKQDQIFTFYVKGTDVLGLPDGWTATRFSTGLWGFNWSGGSAGNQVASYAPGIFVTPMHTSGGSSTTKYTAYVYPRDVGGNWSAFNTMVGFTLQIETGGEAADGACSIVVIG